MKTPLRILALASILVFVGACGRPTQVASQASEEPAKQTNNYDFSFQDFVPLIQINDSFVQEAHGILNNKFKLSYRPHINISFMVVKVNGQILRNGYNVSGMYLVFETAPVANSQIAVSYDPENLRESIAINTITLPENLDLDSIRARFNNQSLYLEDLRMSRNPNGELLLDPSAIIFDYQDKFELIRHRGLSLELSAIKVE